MIGSAFALPFIVVFVSSATLPPYIKPCKRDSKLNECAVIHGNEAIPKFVKGDSKLKIPSLDPILVDEIVITDNGARSVALNITFKDMRIENLSKARIIESKMDLDKKHLEWVIAVPNIRIITKYKVDGKVLILPIRGTGPGEINLDDVKVNYILKYKLNNKKGVDYATFVNSDVNFVAKKLSVKLENLFNGDKTLGDNMNAVLNENWKELMTQMGPPVAKAISIATKPISERLVSQVPFDQIFPK